MVRMFKLIEPRQIGHTVYVEGSTVYEFLHDDFGLAEQESELVGLPFVSVTLSPEGAYPSFTCPVDILREIKD